MSPKLRSGISWSWPHAVRCGVCTLPAVPVILLSDPSMGLAWAVGILPAATIGLGPSRRSRLRLVVVGLLFGVSVLVGSLLAQSGPTAVLGIFVVACGSALIASRKPFGMTVMVLCAPVSAIGLSYSDIDTAAELGLLMIAGSAFSCALFMLWPEHPETAGPARRLLPAQVALSYGIRLGLAAASATAIGLALHTDHLGWAPAAALFVMRPATEMQVLRSVGRIASVLVGALVAVAFLETSPSTAAISLLAVALLAGAGGTHESRWYVTPFFATCLVLTMLLLGDATKANELWRLNERVGETVLGVGLAFVFGLVVPRIGRHLRARQPSPAR